MAVRSGVVAVRRGRSLFASSGLTVSEESLLDSLDLISLNLAGGARFISVPAGVWTDGDGDSLAARASSSAASSVAAVSEALNAAVSSLLLAVSGEMSLSLAVEAPALSSVHLSVSGSASSGTSFFSALATPIIQKTLVRNKLTKVV